jgi:cold shock CspA family protein
MRKKGKIRSWNDQKGFGFIEPSEGDKQIFLHISAFGNRDRRPNVGEYVTYAMSSDKQGRPCAAKATLPGDRLSTTNARRSSGVGVVTVAVIFFALILLLV